MKIITAVRGGRAACNVLSCVFSVLAVEAIISAGGDGGGSGRGASGVALGVVPEKVEFQFKCARVNQNNKRLTSQNGRQ